jgi:hypothetical protein
LERGELKPYIATDIGIESLRKEVERIKEMIRQAEQA